MFLIQFSSFLLFSGEKHGFVYPEVTWLEYSIVNGSEFCALLPVAKFPDNFVRFVNFRYFCEDFVCMAQYL